MPSSARGRSALALLLPLIAVLVAACGGAETPLQDRFAVQGPVLLSVVVEDGDVSVEAGVKGAVVVTGVMDDDRYEYRSTAGGGTVRLEVRRTRSLLTLLRGGEARLRIFAPPGTRLDITASNGAVTATGLLGGGRLETANANIEASGIEGDLLARTSKGSVRVSDHRGDLTVSSSDGSVVVLGQEGGVVTVETSNGLIEYAGTIEPGGLNVLKTANGSIVVELAGDPSLMLDAATTNGTVTSRYAVLEARRTATELRGRIAGGEATLKLRATNGSIEVR